MFVGALDRAEGAVAELVRGFEDESVPAALVESSLERVTALQHQLVLVEAELAVLAADAGLWRRSGHASPDDWHASKTGTSPGKASAKARTARRLRKLPRTRRRMAEGKLSPEKAEAVASGASANPEAESRLLDAAERDSLAELQDKAAAVRAAATDPEERARKQRSLRRLRRGRDAEGMTTTFGAHTPEAGALLWTAIDQRTDEIFGDARRNGTRAPRDAYAADALVDICAEYLARRATSSAAAGTSEGADAPATSAPVKRLPLGAAAKVIVRVDHRVLATGEIGDGDVCEIVGYGPVPVSVVRHLMGDAFLAALLTNGTQITNVVHLGRKPTALQMTALQDLYSTCVIAGCGRSKRLETDHRIDWAQTHHTTLPELQRLCSHHHRLKTQGWILTRDRDADHGVGADSGGWRLEPPEHERQPRAG